MSWINDREPENGLVKNATLQLTIEGAYTEEDVINFIEDDSKFTRADYQKVKNDKNEDDDLTNDIMSEVQEAYEHFNDANLIIDYFIEDLNNALSEIFNEDASIYLMSDLEKYTFEKDKDKIIVTFTGINYVTELDEPLDFRDIYFDKKLVLSKINNIFQNSAYFKYLKAVDVHITGGSV